jgi:hypothetical protein
MAKDKIHRTKIGGVHKSLEGIFQAKQWAILQAL